MAREKPDALFSFQNGNVLRLRLSKIVIKKTTYKYVSGFFVNARLMHILKLSLFFNPQVLY